MTSEFDPPKPKLAALPPPKVLTELDFQKIREEIEEKKLERNWQDKHGWKDPNVGTCRVCSGKVYGHVKHEYDPSSGPMIIGPGSRNQIRAVHLGYECSECYLVYRKCPGEVTRMTREEIEKYSG